MINPAEDLLIEDPILIVDDREENLISFQAVLKSENYKVEVASSGEEALKKILKQKYALILLDVQMPEMDGFEVAQILRATEVTHETPIIFISAINIESKYVKLGLNSGAIDYIPKPVDPDILKMKIAIFLKIYQQKNQLKKAHKIILNKNKEILDSITYAKRIQTSILPPLRVVKEFLKESFVMYKPKDVVAGDFYWMESRNGMIIYATADCTGHGVPGAMMSLVCYNALNRSVREYGISDPGEILNKTRAIIDQEFDQSEEELRDGMDIAICTLQNNRLKYAGAYIPLWIIKKGSSNIIEVKADKQPIGKFHNPRPYTTHSFALESGDTIYIFSDGYVDQFGGVKGKKFLSKRFRSLLLSVQEKSMEDQYHVIEDTFENWKGALEQIDDVCIIGVRIE